jgi:hypothetical protein
MKIFYSVEDVSPGELLPIMESYFKTRQREYLFYESDSLEIIAQDAAEDYHHNHDGWEHSSWPIEIHLYDENEKILGKFSVDRDVEPVFSARKIK